MKKKPIIFNSEMVRAILDGRKTQTRRLGKLQSDRYVEIGASSIGHATKGVVTQATYRAFPGRGTARWAICESPYEIGDVLYVRETFTDFYGSPIYYRADGELGDLCYNCGLEKSAHHMGGQEHTFTPDIPKWTPSIHMPEKLSRIHLEVTRVRVERACDISEEDAKAEGCESKRGFLILWQSIYGHFAEDKWCWCIDFRRVK